MPATRKRGNISVVYIKFIIVGHESCDDCWYLSRYYLSCVQYCLQIHNNYYCSKLFFSFTEEATSNEYMTESTSAAETNHDFQTQARPIAIEAAPYQMRMFSDRSNARNDSKLSSIEMANNVDKQNTPEEIQNEAEEPCNMLEVTLSLAERYLSIETISFFDLFVLDTKRRVSVSLDKVMISCSEEVIGMRPCILIEGESGTGKTTLLRHLASQWAMKKALHEFSAVLLYEVYVEQPKHDDSKDKNEHHNNMYGFNNCYGMQIKDDRKSNDNLIHQLEEDAKLLHGSTNRSDILILLDSFWYLPFTLSIIKTCRKYFPKAAIVFTGQPDLVKARISEEIKSITHYYKILGYQPDTIDDAIQFLLTPCKIEKFHAWLEQNPFAQALVNCPLYCKMLTELFVSNCLPNYLENLTELFRLYIILLINKSRKFSRPIEYFSDLTGDDDLLFRSIVEMTFTFPKIYQNESCRPQTIKSFGLLKEISFRDHIIVSFINSSTMAYFMALFYNVSVHKPKNAPFDWPAFCLYLAGMKTLDIIREVIFCDPLRKYNDSIKIMIVFELQLSILQIPRESDSLRLDRKILSYTFSKSMEAEPIVIYALGWLCLLLNNSYFSELNRIFPDSVELIFDIPYVVKISKYLLYFSTGTKHNAKFSLPVNLHQYLRIEILNAVDDVGECLQYLIEANLCQYLTKLHFSGAVKLQAADEIDGKHFSGLTSLEISGKLSTECNALLALLPKLGSVRSIAFHNKSDDNSQEVDLKCLQKIKSLCNVTIDGISPELSVGRFEGLSRITILNCTLSPVIIESLIKWVANSLRWLTLQGQGIVSVEVSVQLALTLDQLEPFKHQSNKEYPCNSRIYLNDTAMSFSTLVPIVSAVSRLIASVTLHIPSKHYYDFGRRLNLDYNCYVDD